jgi:hypothetical protein
VNCKEINGKPCYFLSNAKFTLGGVRFQSVGLRKTNGNWFYDIKNLETGEVFEDISEIKLIERFKREFKIQG